MMHFTRCFSFRIVLFASRALFLLASIGCCAAANYWRRNIDGFPYFYSLLLLFRKEITFSHDMASYGSTSIQRLSTSFWRRTSYEYIFDNEIWKSIYRWIRVRSSVVARPRFRHVRYDWQLCIFGTTGVKSYRVTWVWWKSQKYILNHWIYWLLSPSVLIIIFEWHRQSPSPSSDDSIK